MFKNVIMFPSRLGQLKYGVEKTPHFLKPLIRKDIYIRNSFVKEDNLSYNLYNLFLENSYICGRKVNIGGDHSMSIATVAESLRVCHNLKVIWVDAHCDINTYEASETKNYHGMPLSFLTGLDDDKLFSFTKNKLDTSNLLYIGIRDIDPFERMILNEYKIKYISSKDINTKTEECIKLVNEFVKNDKVHLSFDVDGLDPEVMPSTGTSSPGGIQLEPCKKLLDNMLNRNLISVDITELNLDIGTVEDKSKSLVNLTYLFKNYIF